MEDLKNWAIHSAIRAVKTAAQTAVATVVANVGSSGLITDVDWIMVFSATALAFVLSIITSVAGIPEVDDGASVMQIAKSSKEQ